MKRNVSNAPSNGRRWLSVFPHIITIFAIYTNSVIKELKNSKLEWRSIHGELVVSSKR